MTDTPYAPTPRRRSKPPVTWPAFVLAALVGIGAALYYGLKVRPIRLYDEDLSYTLWHALSPSLVPATVGALAIWSLLYFGFVRWKNGERGPLYFNLLFPIMLCTLVALPFGQRAYESWKAGDVKGMQADLLKARSKASADELAARAPLTAGLTAASEAVRLKPEALVLAADRRQAKAQLAVVREASKLYHAGYPKRAAAARVAYAQAVARHKVSPEIARAALAQFDRDFATQIARNDKILSWEQDLVDEALAGIAALEVAPWKVEGQNIYFASREAGNAFIRHHRQSEELRFKLQNLSVGTADVVVIDVPTLPSGLEPARSPDDYN
jgi:hypothetical protein